MLKQVLTSGSGPTAATDCTPQPLLFPELAHKPVTVDFDGGRISSDGGAVLLGRLDRSFGYLKRFSTCFTDHRDPDLVEHSLVELLRQRVYGLALGYEDLNDHDQLCRDPLLASVCGKRDVEGQNRQRRSDRGKALAGKSTLNRLELTLPQATASQRYKKIVADSEGIEAFFIAEFVRSLAKETQEVVLDLDATDDPLYGRQEGRFFHGYYGDYCYLPLYIFSGDWPVLAWLRTSDRDASEGTTEKVAKIVAALRERLSGVRITLRADSGFCRDGLMSWCEDHGVHYVFGLARNAVLQRELADSLVEAQRLSEAEGGTPARVFHEFDYAAKTWERQRRVIGKAEWTQGEANPRFIITNLVAETNAGRGLYEGFYCARGDMENRIKEQQLDLYADRTSTATMLANQLRLWFSTLAYLLLNQLRRAGLAGTEWARATCGTIRLKLLKIGAVVQTSVRRVVVHLSSAWPWRSLFEEVATRLAVQPDG